MGLSSRSYYYFYYYYIYIYEMYMYAWKKKDVSLIFLMGDRRSQYAATYRSNESVYLSEICLDNIFYPPTCWFSWKIYEGSYEYVSHAINATNFVMMFLRFRTTIYFIYVSFNTKIHSFKELQAEVRRRTRLIIIAYGSLFTISIIQSYIIYIQGGFVPAYRL